MAATNNLVLSLSLKSDEFKADLEKEKSTITKWSADISRQTSKMLKSATIAPFKFIKDQLFSIKGLLISTFSLAGVGAFFKKTSDSVKEMKDLARTSRLTTDEFQRLSFAASTVGVEASKVADFMNDALLKINEYAMEGSGEGANIVKMLQKAGYALKDIKDLKGEALFDAISDAAEKTGIDVDTLTRYLDELASDPGVDLASVFTYDRSKFKQAMKDFSDLDIALSDDLIKNTDDTRAAWTKLSLIIEKFGQIYYASLGPVLTYIGTYLTDILTETAKTEGGFKALGLTLASQTVGAFKDVITAIREMIGSFKYGIYQIQEVANKFGADLNIIDDPFKAQKKAIDDYEEKLESSNDKISKIEGKMKDNSDIADDYYWGIPEEVASKIASDNKDYEEEMNRALGERANIYAEMKAEKEKLESLKDNLSSSSFAPEAGPIETSFGVHEEELLNKSDEAAKKTS
ncbi:hypothetical protein JK628_23075 (plasmid) [Shewanella sp. KX20019]|uniref:hypothetical protein n=1 Tax=Shewanella sp. KX20019 TaxID=2803864 RepID=UPI0019297EDD|nr:hypothetical protein [Shewanella sp. KX20019]QQX82697.1 hypothetical protein JK628_23075 [Shewanella sp. KX20019]